MLQLPPVQVGGEEVFTAALSSECVPSTSVGACPCRGTPEPSAHWSWAGSPEPSVQLLEGRGVGWLSPEQVEPRNSPGARGAEAQGPASS